MTQNVTARLALNKQQVLDIVAAGRQGSLECSGLLLATYVFSNAGYWLDFQANISDALTKTAWEPPDTQRIADWRRRPAHGAARSVQRECASGRCHGARVGY